MESKSSLAVFSKKKDS